MTLRALIPIFCLALLSGCATLDEDQCRTANWHELGVRDGLAGKPASHLREHIKACSEYGVRINEAAYQDGRATGLREYCQLDNAIETGLKGKQYQGVCPASVDRLFQRYNEAAYEVYRLRAEIDRTNSSIDEKSQRLRDKKLDEDRRADLRRDIRDLDRRLDNLRDELRDRERTLDRLLDDMPGRKRVR